MNRIDRDRWQECQRFLKDCTEMVLEKCRVENEYTVDGKKQRFTLRFPSGDMKYGAFWVRDSSMMAESGLLSSDELKGWIKLVALLGQNGENPVALEHGVSIPPWAVADHINLDGGAVFYPGTYNSGKEQGDGTYGAYPPHDDQYYFIEMGYLYYLAGGDPAFFSEKIKGAAIIQCFENAFKSYNIDEATGLCVSQFPRHTVDWGFCDSIVKSGFLLFPSLLRYRAALHLKELFDALGDSEKACEYGEKSALLCENIQKYFYDDSGWFLSATGLSRQKDVWGTAFALWLGIPADPELAQKTAGKLLEAYRDGTVVDNGYVRHILTTENASKITAWEKAWVSLDDYQNGGYWATPSGWYLYALSLVDPAAALKMTGELIVHTKAWQEKGAPFEWRSTDDQNYSGLYYGTSAALPYAAVVRVAGD